MTILKALLQRKLALLGLIVILAFVILALFAPWIAPFPYAEIHKDGLTDFGSPLPPSAKYWLGTDTLGRDLLSRLIFGAQATLIVAIIANTIAVRHRHHGRRHRRLSARLGRHCADALHRPHDRLPRSAAGDPAGRDVQPQPLDRGHRDRHGELGPGRAGRLHRDASRSPSASSSPPSAASAPARCASCSGTCCRISSRRSRSMRRSASPPPSLTEATLSFLGIGVQPPTPSWGNMVNENQTYFEVAPWLVFIPSGCIGILALSFNLIGDALARHPRSHLAGAALMIGYVLRRLVQMLLTLVGISIITFLITHALPADPARQIAGRTASAAQVEMVRHRFRPRSACR